MIGSTNTGSGGYRVVGTNIEGNTWETKTALTTYRYKLTSNAVNDLIYAIGGNNGSAQVATNYCYDPSANRV